MKQQKQQLEANLIEYKREVEATSKGSAAKEVRILKTMVKSLEGDLLREKTKHQKSGMKRNAECRRLLDEVSVQVEMSVLGSTDHPKCSKVNVLRLRDFSG